MTNVTVGAAVECSDGAYGELVALIIDPGKRIISHYVVKAKSNDVQRMVLAEHVVSSTSERLLLNSTRSEVDGMPPFVKTDVVAKQVPESTYGAGMGYDYYYGYGLGYGSSSVITETQYVNEQTEQIPAGEMALKRGLEVRAADGKVGSVSNIVLDESGLITHFGVDEGHHNELTLPVSVISYTDDEGVHLKLDKAGVKSLPTMPAGHSAGHERMELLARVFNDMKGAEEALDRLHQAARSSGKDLKVREAAVLVRDADGKARIVQSSQPSMGKGALVGAAAGGLLTLLGPLGIVAGAALGAGAGAVVGPKIDMGFPDAFLKRLETRLEPGYSALVVLVEHDEAMHLTDMVAEPDKVVGGQQIVDTLVQELLLEKPAV